MRKLLANRLYIVIISSILLFVIMSTVSLTSLELLQGNARVVNYVGIVRGATQKLVKEELMGYPDDALVARLDGIINELLTGEGSEGLVVLDDSTYLDYMGRVQESWVGLKEHIYTVRDGGGTQELFDASQEYFELVNDTVFAAENYSESQVGRINGIMIAINVAFIALIVVVSVFVVRSIAVRRRADALGQIAYVDPLTKIANRASCEQRVAELMATPPEQKVTAFMFDMNDLKLTNDFLGHQGGDKIIVAFAAILAEAAEPYGFLGRYGGDEFV
ncbi:MAG TPA: hypothetical protein DEB24_02605, partial [Coriobacteriia bacterium]|nr:hypothetical protein [Coriobacteriia bacterium]